MKSIIGVKYIVFLAVVVTGIAVVVLMYSNQMEQNKSPTSPFGSLAQARIDQGAQLFTQNCAACHGVGAQGGVAPFVVGDKEYVPPALNGTAHTWHHSPLQLQNYIKRGSPDPQSPMVGLGDRLSDAQIGEILTYLYANWPERLQKRYAQHNN